MEKKAQKDKQCEQAVYQVGHVSFLSFISHSEARSHITSRQQFIHTTEIFLWSASQTVFGCIIDFYIEYLNIMGMQQVCFIGVRYCDRKRMCVVMLAGRKGHIKCIFCYPFFLHFLSNDFLNWAALSHCFKKPKRVICLVSHPCTDHPGGRGGRPSVPGRSSGTQRSNHTLLTVMLSRCFFTLKALNFTRKLNLNISSSHWPAWINDSWYSTIPVIHWRPSSGPFCSTIQLPFASAVL